MPLYTKPPLFEGGSSGLVNRGMLQIIRGQEHAPLSETENIGQIDQRTNTLTHSGDKLLT